MKYNHILSISIPIGILLSGCTTPVSEPSGSNKAPAKGQIRYAPIPNYVKHNPGLQHIKRKVACPGLPSYIYAQLVSPKGDNEAYIHYIITEKDAGIPGEWHFTNSGNNENQDSSLFGTTFKFDTLDLQPARDGSGEVLVTGTDKNGKSHTWKSDSTAKKDDDDVTWHEQ